MLLDPSWNIWLIHLQVIDVKDEFIISCTWKAHCQFKSTKNYENPIAKIKMVQEVEFSKIWHHFVCFHNFSLKFMINTFYNCNLKPKIKQFEDHQKNKNLCYIRGALPWKKPGKTKSLGTFELFVLQTFILYFCKWHTIQARPQSCWYT